MIVKLYIQNLIAGNMLLSIIRKSYTNKRCVSCTTVPKDQNITVGFVVHLDIPRLVYQCELWITLHICATDYARVNHQG